jgi:hypothetical protein
MALMHALVEGLHACLVCGEGVGSGIGRCRTCGCTATLVAIVIVVMTDHVNTGLRVRIATGSRAATAAEPLRLC